MSSPPSISPERWQQIIDVFHAVTNADPADCDAVLEELCQGDPDLRACVQRLLDADAEASVLVPTAVGTRLSIEQPSADGEHVGPYQLQGEIGRGGMGVVYRATRADVGNTVAVKMLREQFPSKERTERFVQEQHVLGQLEHPGIARFLDAGVTSDKTPYLVMEYVDGRPVTEAAQEMDLRERLELFLDICAAVRYAHRNLVVHRDLKPSNVLVTGDGTVKLLDFGIAKVLEEDATITATRHRVMTLAYAAPEQVEGGTVSTATDVYALGILLYELLTGHRPLALADLGFPEAVRRILHETPTAPSSRGDATSPDGVSAAALRGDLDTICLKALRKEPERRYESVEALRDDIQRYLSDRPITARPDSLSYRTTKFVRRNRASVVAAGLALLVLSALLTFYTTRLADERDRATAQAEISESVTAFLVQTLQEGDPDAASGDTLTVHDVINRAETRASDLDDNPLVKANVFDAIGEVRLLHGNLKKADSLFRVGLTLRETALSPTHPDVAASLNHLAEAQIMLGQFAQAETSMQRGITILKAAHGASSPELVTPTKVLAQVRYRQGRYASSDSLYNLVISMQERTPVLSEDSYADTYQEWGNVAQVRGDYEAARQRYQTAVNLYQDRHPDGSILVATAYVNLASVERQLGNYDAAMDGYASGMEMTKRLVGERHINVALIQSNLAVAHQRVGNLDTAEAMMRENVQLREDLLGSEHPYAATSHHVLAKILAEQGKNAEAETHFRRSLAVRTKATPEHWRTAASQLELGHLLAKMSRFEDAESLLINGITGLARTRGSDHTAVENGRRYLARLYTAWQRPGREQAARDRLAEAGISFSTIKDETIASATATP